jgi:hypothetical protein
MLFIIPAVLRVVLMVGSLGLIMCNIIKPDDEDDHDQQRDARIISESYANGLGQAL